MWAGLIARLFGTNNKRQLNKLKPIIARINELEVQMKGMLDEQFPLMTQQLREQISNGKSLDDILPEAFALVRETASRKLGQRHYDEQLMGGIVLHQGKIAEMKTGEGKTLTATLPLYLNALSGKTVHLITVNDYLARRDAAWMGPVYQQLGLNVAVLQHAMADHERKAAYRADVLYGTNSEFGFDYLRDNMKFRLEDYVQTGLGFGIVDEVDSILIDESRVPLLISGGLNESSDHISYKQVNNAVKYLEPLVDYEIDEKESRVTLTEVGNDKIEKIFHIKNLYTFENILLQHRVNQSLKAHALFKRDVKYVIRDNEVLIVDEFTGRILSGRRYSDGLHQAIEAKEGVDIEQETQTLASITLQNFFRLYKKLAGMTGTAITEAEEFYQIYRLSIVSIPTHEMVIRTDKSDLIFLTKKAKYKAIIEDVLQRVNNGQPVLIGTISVETSELLSDIFTQHHIEHEVLNAKNHQREAEIVAHAGEKGRVTIATNMAGRGTDIKLTEESRLVGGLYILGTERHESRRIDNQLRGRSGRQGDPGESRFYISLEDDLIRIFAGETMKRRMEMVGMKEDEVIESGIISKTIENSQEKVEKYNFEMRKHLLEYDDVLNQQRLVVYRYRFDILVGENKIEELVNDMVVDTVADIFAAHTTGDTVSDDATKNIFKSLSQLSGIAETEWEKKIGKASLTGMIENIEQELLLVLNLKMNSQDPGMQLKSVQKWIMLESIDRAWKQHMLNIDSLKEGIGLRQVGQKNPLIEYKRESFQMFQDMMKDIRWEILNHIFSLDMYQFDEKLIERRREQELAEMNLQGGGQLAGDVVLSDDVQKMKKIKKRNELCDCGSGKKFKKCCGLVDAH